MPIILLCHFWLAHPALLYGIAFTLGLYCHFSPTIWLLVPCSCLCLPFLIGAWQSNHLLNNLALMAFLFFTAWIYAAANYSCPTLPDQGVYGQAVIQVRNLQLQHSHFGKRWIYRCVIKQFVPEESPHTSFSSIPCMIALPSQRSRPLADQDYWINGKLVPTKMGSYAFKVSSKELWNPIDHSFNLAEHRYGWKKKVIQWMDSHFSYSSSATFLAGLVTGEFDDDQMKKQFARFGLQHLLAISGFHFGIIASFLSFLLRICLSQRLQIFTLLTALAIYCLFLGAQPSILRAWMMCSLFLFGQLIEKQTNSLNLLGVALFGVLMYDPLFCKELGFQLSFLITAGILLFYHPIQVHIDQILAKRSLSDVIKMHHVNQYGYCILSFLRKAIALSVAVNLCAFPLTLYYFHQFPWMSLLYNLFFPLLASLSVCLLLLGMFVSFIPILPEIIHHMNDCYTHALLQFTYQIPSEIDSYLTCEFCASQWILFYLCLAFCWGIIEKQSLSSQNKNELSFPWI